MQDSLDLVSLGQGHLLEQGHQLRVPVQHQSVTLSNDCIHKQSSPPQDCHMALQAHVHMLICAELLPQTFARCASVHGPNCLELC